MKCKHATARQRSATSAAEIELPSSSLILQSHSTYMLAMVARLLVPASDPGVAVYTQPRILKRPIPSRPPKSGPNFPQSPYDPRSLWRGWFSNPEGVRTPHPVPRGWAEGTGNSDMSSGRPRRRHGMHEASQPIRRQERQELCGITSVDVTIRWLHRSATRRCGYAILSHGRIRREADAKTAARGMNKAVLL